MRLALIVPLLTATLVLHLSGTDLVILKVARIILLATLVAGLAYLRRRRNQPDHPSGGSEPDSPPARITP